MNWTRLRWTDLRDNLLVALQVTPPPADPPIPTMETALTLKVPDQEGGCRAHGHVATPAFTGETVFQLPHSGGLHVPTALWPSAGPLEQERDRLFLPQERVDEAARVAGCVVVAETVRRLREAGRQPAAWTGGGTSSSDPRRWWVVPDLPARAGAYAVAPGARGGDAEQVVRHAIALAGLTPVPLPWPGGGDAAGETAVQVRIGVGVARRADGHAVVPWDDLKQVSRVVEAMLLREEE